MTRALRASEYALLMAGLPAAMLVALWQSPAWPGLFDPSAIVPANFRMTKLAWYALLLALPCALVCWAARRPAIVLGGFVAVVLSFVEVDAAASSWASLVGVGGAGAPSGKVLLLGLAPIAVLLTAFAVGEDRRMRDALAKKRLPTGAADAALGRFRRDALVAGGVAISAAFVLALVMPHAAAPQAARNFRVVGLLVAAVLLVAAIGVAAGWFSRRTPAGDA